MSNLTYNPMADWGKRQQFGKLPTVACDRVRKTKKKIKPALSAPLCTWTLFVKLSQFLFYFLATPSVKPSIICGKAW